MKILSQRDVRWSSAKLGSSKLTVGRYGCTTTALSMLSDYFGCYLSPLDIASNKKWYTKDGLVLWDKLDFRCMSFVRREFSRNDSNILAALKDPNTAVILQVDNGQHWVAAMRRTMFGNDYAVADPLFGKTLSACAVYKNITGAAFFKRK